MKVTGQQHQERGQQQIRRTDGAKFGYKCEVNNGIKVNLELMAPLRRSRMKRTASSGGMPASISDRATITGALQRSHNHDCNQSSNGSHLPRPATQWTATHAPLVRNTVSISLNHWSITSSGGGSPSSKARSYKRLSLETASNSRQDRTRTWMLFAVSDSMEYEGSHTLTSAAALFSFSICEQNGIWPTQKMTVTHLRSGTFPATRRWGGR